MIKAKNESYFKEKCISLQSEEGEVIEFRPRKTDEGKWTLVGEMTVANKCHPSNI